MLKSVQLAKEGQQEQTRQLIEVYTHQNPLDARGWWVMANIIDDTPTKHADPKHVLELKPNNAKARTMLEDLELDALFSLSDVPFLCWPSKDHKVVKLAPLVASFAAFSLNSHP